MKTLLTIGLMLSMAISFAQTSKEMKFNKETNLIEATYYFENGKICQTGTFNKDGKLHGEWLCFDQKGNKTVSANYENGKKVGKWFYWSGEVLKEVDYTNNSIANVTEWTNKELIAGRN